MKIVEYTWTLTPDRRVWIAVESEEEGKEKQTGFSTEREARVYRDAVCDLCCFRRQSPNNEALIAKLLAEVERLWGSATVVYG